MDQHQQQHPPQGQYDVKQQPQMQPQYPPQGQYDAQQQQPHQEQQYQYQPQQAPQATQQTQHATQHPPAQESEWQASFCSCSPFTSCLLGWCLPCLLVGKTSERMRDPSLQTYKPLNTDCLLMCGISYLGLGCIYAMIKRGEIRDRFGIKGSTFGDCCSSYWCPCCVLIQNDNEVVARLGDPSKGPVVQGYQQNQGMSMPAPKN